MIKSKKSSTSICWVYIIKLHKVLCSTVQNSKVNQKQSLSSKRSQYSRISKEVRYFLASIAHAIISVWNRLCLLNAYGDFKFHDLHEACPVPCPTVRVFSSTHITTYINLFSFFLKILHSALYYTYVYMYYSISKKKKIFQGVLKSPAVVYVWAFLVRRDKAINLQKAFWTPKC